MTEGEFAFLARFLRDRSGLDLAPGKRYLAESRLGPVYRSAGLATLGELVRRLRTGGDAALERAVVEAMATHETSFFRDKLPFEVLRTEILPGLIAARSGTRRLRIWSAAASTGQEAYSVAMLIRDLEPGLADWHVDILGTDLSRAAIARARAGFYSQLEVQRGLPILKLLQHFAQVEGEGWRIAEPLREAVDFRVCNLLDGTRRFGTFDLILCRNLLIYLAADAKAKLLSKLARALAPDGAICLGTAESVMGMESGLVPHPTARGFFVLAAGERRYAAA
jgi:chemotaxis protein methyltransferase CheR